MQSKANAILIHNSEYVCFTIHSLTLFVDYLNFYHIICSDQSCSAPPPVPKKCSKSPKKEKNICQGQYEKYQTFR